MATRVKKQSAITKDATSSQTTVKNPLAIDTTPKSTSKGQNVPGLVRKLATTRSPSKRIIKRTAAALKAKARQQKLKINPTSISDSLEQNGKKLPAITKKALLKNNIKTAKPRKGRVAKIKEEIVSEETAPTLQEITEESKSTITKKRIRKTKVPELIELKKIKTEPPEVEEPDNITDKLHDLISEANDTTKKPNRKARKKKIKVEVTESPAGDSTIDSTIDDVMSDLSLLIKEGNIKKEPDDSMSESSKSDSFKPKKLTKKQKLDKLKNEIKKENIENTFSKMNESEKTVINMLDINAKNLTPDSQALKRRHSIEKFPLSSENNATESAPSVFNQLPRCISPRASKKNSKIRQSLDGMSPRRGSPYSTRSETPTRLLRNGKNSQLKGNLLKGVEGNRRRKKNISDVTSAEISGKLSEYDSDSSYSDLASLHGSEKEAEVAKPEETEESCNVKIDDLSLQNLKNTCISSEDQDSLTQKPDNDLIDTNSNVCRNVNENIPNQKVKPEEDKAFSLEDSPSYKVPEKSLILVSMKQMFNEKTEQETSTLIKCEASKFYGKTEKQDDNLAQEEIDNKAEVIEKKEESLPPLEGFDFDEEINILIPEKESTIEKPQTISRDFSPTDEFSSKNCVFLQDFAAEEKEAEEQRSFENIVQECIESIDDTKTPEQNTPVPEPSQESLDHSFDDAVPVIENMADAVVNDGNVEHLEPPTLERSVEHFSIVTEIDSENTSESENNQKIEEDPLANDKMEIDPFANEKEEVDPFANEKTEVKPFANKKTEVEPFANEKMEVDAPANEEVTTVDPMVNDKTEIDPLATEEENLTEKIIEERVKETATEFECDKLEEASETLEINKIEPEDDKIENKEPQLIIQESPEDLQRKESILSALGLQSKSAPLPRQSKRERQHKQNDDFYTGTLKTVIKINRDKKKGKNSFKMTLQKNKVRSDVGEIGHMEDFAREGPSTSSWKPSKEGPDSAGAHRKTHNSNRSNTEGSGEQTSDSESQAASGEATEKALLIPEKASSFSIHPGRLCKDECSYCFGKFGLFDTPCHIAQLKSVERQNKILQTEKHLTRDSCLCDACYRHVDRKANTPSYTNKSFKRNSLVAPGPRQNHCHVLGCSNVSTNILRRKWIMKMRKSICQRINIDLDNPGLHSIPICDEHYTALEHLMICAMCKRHLAKNHIHYLGPEVAEINNILREEGIAIQLSDRPVVCKLCKCFTSVLLKDPEERPENSKAFFEEYKKRLLHFNDIVPMDAAEAEEPIVIPGKNDKNQDKELPKKKHRDRNHSGESKDSQEGENGDEGQNRAENRTISTDTNNSQSQGQSRSESPEEDEYASIDFNALIPAVNLECPSDNENGKSQFQRHQKQMYFGMQRKVPRPESMRDAVEASKSLRAVRHHKPNDLAVQKLGQNPSISLRPAYSNYQDKESWEKCGNLGGNSQISVRQLFPGEEELPLAGHIEFNNVKEVTTEGWEKCTSTIQYDEETKLLWQELQKPYGNQSSFLRHLILLEKYFRNGDLILSPHATHHAINYRESVMNRLRSYDNIPSNAPQHVQPITMVPFNKLQQKSQSGIITSAAAAENKLIPNVGSGHSVTISQISNGSSGGSVSSKTTPITLQQLNSPPLLPTNAMLQNLSANQKAKSSGAPPPGLISIQPGSARPNLNPVAAIVNKVQPQSQKIKFPITKNWRPNLIPIDPTKKQERKTGLVQVISGGKPYHITLEDYKKMCAIKRSFEAKQKKMQEQQLAQKQLQQVAVVQPQATPGQLQAVTTQQQPSAVLVQQPNSILKHIIPKKGGGMIISKSGGTVTENRQILPVTSAISVTPSVTLTGISLASTSAAVIPSVAAPLPVTSAPVSAAVESGHEKSETILEKLDKAVEKLGPADR